MSLGVSEKETWGEVEREVVSVSKEKISRTEGDADFFFFDDLPSTARFKFSGLRIHDPHVTVPCPDSIDKHKKGFVFVAVLLDSFSFLFMETETGAEKAEAQAVKERTFPPKNPGYIGQYLESSNLRTMTPWCPRVLLLGFFFVSMCVCVCVCVCVWSLPYTFAREWKTIEKSTLWSVGVYFGVSVDILLKFRGEKRFL